MRYGDGDGVSYGPLVSLDVAGHEMTHGVTIRTAGLTYRGESGGLNESTSDIFGTMVECYANNAGDPGDYLIGEEIRHSTRRQAAALHGPAVARTARRPGLLEHDRRQPRRALLLGRRQPLLLPAVRGQRREDDQRRQLQQPDLQRLHGDRHRPRRGRRDLVPRADDVLDLVDELRRCPRRHADAAKDLYGAGSTQYNATAAAWSAVNVN